MNYYEQIKEQLINNEIYKKVKDYSKNKNDLTTYYNVGKLIIEAQGGEKRAKYGDNLIKEYSKKLTNELGKGYSTRSLKYMRQFYLFQKGQALPAQLSWSHFCELLSLKNQNEINYYINIAKKQNLGYRRFLKELGDGFTFIDKEYPIKIGNRYNYIDLLLFNYIYNCFIVIELKTTELKKEHLGQIQVYMNYIDENIKQINNNKTIGIIICKEDNKLVLKYCSDERIYSTKYITI